ncbi:MAG: UDP-N-acetylmuramate dehydrogenase, partial [Deltaproteobacteria bacterium]|nr:UDP-N-acetylmuramate dehydrogenase [Deltaproteobacteria bacterium]
TLSFGFAAGCDVRAADVVELPGAVSFSLQCQGEEALPVRMPVPGRHNVLNALAAVAAARAAGVPPRASAAGLGVVRLPRRRFEKTVDTDALTVISDYAHHPTEIAALVAAARGLGRKRILAVFQPHRYTRTRALGADFPPAFTGIDELVLLPVYAASEAPLAEGTVWDLYRRFRELPGSLVPTPRVATSLDQAWQYLRRELRPGDLLLVIGAGDVEVIAQWAQRADGAGNLRPDPVELCGLTDGSRVRLDEPLAGKTTIRVGGRADTWVDVECVADLGCVLRQTRERGFAFQLLGAGSNVLVSDLGVRGVVVRLTGAVFNELRSEDGLVTVGAAVSMARLQGWLEEQGLGGLESLEGIPGSVGGAVHMNAGAYGDEIGNHLVRARCLDPDGAERVLEGRELGLRYRLCEGLRGRFVVSADLSVAPADRAEIGQRRRAIAERRSWMKGIRSAGSIFRNPPGEHAGRLSERAGMKGMAVGGASVLERHGNVIVTGPGSTASDVRALIELIRVRVFEQTSVELRTEVELVG